MPIVKNRIKNFLSENEYTNEFSHTVLHNFNPLRDKNPDFVKVQEQQAKKNNFMKPDVYKDVQHYYQQNRANDNFINQYRPYDLKNIAYNPRPYPGDCSKVVYNNYVKPVMEPMQQKMNYKIQKSSPKDIDYFKGVEKFEDKIDFLQQKLREDDDK